MKDKRIVLAGPLENARYPHVVPETLAIALARGAA